VRPLEAHPSWLNGESGRQLDSTTSRLARLVAGWRVERVVQSMARLAGVSLLCAGYAAGLQVRGTTGNPVISPFRFLRLLTDVQFGVAVHGVGGLLIELIKGESPESRLRAGVDFEIRDAGSGRGQGVFARRELQADELLARYTGRLWSQLDWDAAFAAGLTSGDYVCDRLRFEQLAPSSTRTSSFG
jgi:hypothetical protein